MRGLIPLLAAVACLTFGCSETRDVEALRREPELTDQLESVLAENAALRRDLTALATSLTAGANEVKAIGEELRALRAELKVTERPEVRPILVDPEVEERLLQKVEEMNEAVWNSPPSACVRILLRVIDRYPNTRAALRAQGLLIEWDASGTEVTEVNAAELDAKIRAKVRSRSKIWRRIHLAKGAAQAGRVEEAVRTLVEVTNKHPGEVSREAANILERWGLADMAVDEIDFATVAPGIRRQETAQRDLEAAFRMLNRGRPRLAAEAFNRVVENYPDVPQAEQARNGLEEAQQRVELQNTEHPDRRPGRDAVPRHARQDTPNENGREPREHFDEPKKSDNDREDHAPLF